MALPIVTGMGEARNTLLMRTAEAVIAIGGEYGTLSEIALALKFGRPVVGIRTWRLASKDDLLLPLHPVNTAGEAVAAVLALLPASTSR